MKMVRIFFIFLFLVGCTSSQKSFKIGGNYYQKGKDYTYELIISSSDSTFQLTESHLDTRAKCIGKWTMISKDSMRLSCFPDTNIINQMSTGYMAIREKTLRILNSKELMLGQIKLKKK